MPIFNLNIAQKTNFVERPSIASTQKIVAEEVNSIVNAIQANALRVILNWDNDIINNQNLVATQYIEYSGDLWRIDTGYNVGTPKTFDGAKATNLTSDTSTDEPFLTTAEASKVLTAERKIYFYTGTGTTWTMFAVAGNSGKKITVKNIGTGVLVLQRAGTDQFHSGGLTNSISIGPSESYTFCTNENYHIQI